jgi:hypothetical protein
MNMNKLKAILRKTVEKLKTVNKKIWVGVTAVVVIGFIVVGSIQNYMLNHYVSKSDLLEACADDNKDNMSVRRSSVKTSDTFKIKLSDSAYLSAMKHCEHFRENSPQTFKLRYK